MACPCWAVRDSRWCDGGCPCGRAAGRSARPPARPSASTTCWCSRRRRRSSGRRSSIMLRNATRSDRFTAAPSTVSSMPPNGCMFRPVAVTMMSASSSRPDASMMPVSVKVSIRSVTTEARAVADRLEQVAVGYHAQPLVPRVVRRVEVLVDRVALGQLLGVHVADELAGGAWEALRRSRTRRAAGRCSCCRVSA